MDHSQQEESKDKSSLERYKEFFKQEKKNEKGSIIPKEDSRVKYVEKGKQFFTVLLLQHSSNLTTLTLRVQLGPYQFDVNVIFEQFNSRAHLLEKKPYKYSDLYSSQEQKNNFVVKCFKTDQNKDNLEEFRKVLREYSFSRVAAAIGVGPPLARPFGFDIQVSNECIQFAFEQCLSIEASKRLFCQNVESHETQLKQKLLKWHELQLVHCNIHPFNLVFHSQLKQFFLTDFGFSRWVPEGVGHQTQTQFTGALTYCNPGMIDIFNGKAQKTDLYMNDVHCLAQTFHYLKESVRIEDKAGKKIRVYKMRDVYDDYATFLSNLGCYYERIESVCAYLFQYYTLLNLYHDLDQNKKVDLKNQTIKKTIQKFPLKITQLIEELSPSVERQEVRDMAYQHLTFKQKEKLQLFILEKKSLLSQYNCIRRQLQKSLQKLHYNFQQLQKQFDCSSDLCRRKTQLQRRVIVNNPVVMKIIEQFACFSHFIRFIEIRQIRSTYKEKVEACQMFIKNYKIIFAGKGASGATIDHPQLQKCLKYILYLWLQKPKGEYWRLIPDVLANLVISDSLSDFDLVHVVQKFGQMAQNKLVEPVGQVVMLFNVYQLLDWIRFKALSLNQYRKVVELVRKIIYQSLLTLKKSHPQDNILKVVINLLVTIMAADSKAIHISPQLLEHKIDNVQILLQEKVIDQLTANRMVALLCLNSAIDGNSGYTQASVLSALSRLENFDPQASRARRIEGFHLRIYALLAYLGSDDVHLQAIKNQFWQTLQVPKLLNKYQLFYQEERKKYNTDQIPRLVKIMEQLSSVEHYKLSLALVNEWEYWLNWITINESTELYSHFIDKLKKTYNEKALYAMDFPLLSHDQDFIHFYHNAYRIICFYLHLHKDKEMRQPVNIGNNFLDQLKSHYDGLKFDGSVETKQNVHHFIILIQIQSNLYTPQGRKDASALFREGVNALLQNQSIMSTSQKIYLLYYAQALLKLAYAMPTKKGQEKCFKKLYQVFKKYGLTELVFSQGKAKNLVLFLSWYSLVIMKSPQQFCLTHNQLWKALQDHPQNIKLYIQTLQVFFEAHEQAFANNAMDIAHLLLGKTMLRSNFNPALNKKQEQFVKINTYYTILLSFLLPLQPINKQIDLLITKHMARSIPALASSAQKFVIKHLFKDRLLDIFNLKQLSKKQLRQSKVTFKRYIKYIEDEQLIEEILKKQATVNKFKKKQLENLPVKLLDQKKQIWEEYLYTYDEDDSDDEEEDDDQKTIA